MKKFNGYNFTGLTKEDNNNIINFHNQEIELFVNENNQVYTEAGIYIADVKEVEEGAGVYCK